VNKLPQYTLHYTAQSLLFNSRTEARKSHIETEDITFSSRAVDFSQWVSSPLRFACQVNNETIIIPITCYTHKGIHQISLYTDATIMHRGMAAFERVRNLFQKHAGQLSIMAYW